MRVVRNVYQNDKARARLTVAYSGCKWYERIYAHVQGGENVASYNILRAITVRSFVLLKYNLSKSSLKLELPLSTRC